MFDVVGRGCIPGGILPAFPADFSQMALQGPDPAGEASRAFHGDKQMHMVRHHRIMADPCLRPFRRLPTEFPESPMDFRIVQPRLSFRRAKSHKEKRTATRSPCRLKTPQATGNFSFFRHGRHAIRLTGNHDPIKPFVGRGYIPGADPRSRIPPPMQGWPTSDRTL